jgi:hypothetical protein
MIRLGNSIDRYIDLSGRFHGGSRRFSRTTEKATFRHQIVDSLQ